MPQHYTNKSEEVPVCGRLHPPPLYLGMVTWGWWGGSGVVEAGKGRALGGLGRTAWKHDFSPTNMEVLNYFNNQRECANVYKVKLHPAPTPLSFPGGRTPLRPITSRPKLHLLRVPTQWLLLKKARNGKRESKCLLSLTSSALSLAFPVRSPPPGPGGRNGKGGRGRR